MKTGMWLSQRQVRWLIVLLALLPLIPSVLLVKMMLQNAVRDRDETLADIDAMYRGQMSRIVERFSEQRNEGGEKDLATYLSRVFEDSIKLAVSDTNGKFVYGNRADMAPQTIVHRIREGEFAGWTIYLDNLPDYTDHMEEQRRQTWWHALWIFTGVICVAGGVWFAVHRRLRVDEIRGDLLATISHEIKTPVAAIQVLLETIESGRLDEVACREYFDLLASENSRIGELADQFLTISRLEKGLVPVRAVDCYLHSLVENQAELMEPQFKHAGGGFTWNCPRDILVRTDPQAVRVILTNLLENALRYGGSPPTAHLSVEVSGRVVEICVSDEGEGIPEANRRAVFRKFYRSDGQLNQGKSGVGLGLAICRRMVRLLRGSIRISDNAGKKGATFVVSLPALANP